MFLVRRGAPRQGAGAPGGRASWGGAPPRRPRGRPRRAPPRSPPAAAMLIRIRADAAGGQYGPPPGEPGRVSAGSFHTRGADATPLAEPTPNGRRAPRVSPPAGQALTPDQEWTPEENEPMSATYR